MLRQLRTLGKKDQVHFLGVEKMNLTQFSLEVR
jgi:hypothetical protein